MKHGKQQNTESSGHTSCDKKIMKKEPLSSVKAEPVDNCKYGLLCHLGLYF